MTETTEQATTSLDKLKKPLEKIRDNGILNPEDCDQVEVARIIGEILMPLLHRISIVMGSKKTYLSQQYETPMNFAQTVNRIFTYQSVLPPATENDHGERRSGRYRFETVKDHFITLHPKGLAEIALEARNFIEQALNDERISPELATEFCNAIKAILNNKKTA